MVKLNTASCAHGSMVNDDVVARVRAVCAERRRRFDALRTREDAENYVREVRAKIRRAFSPLPTERTPLNPEITKTTKFDGYNVSCVVFESRPGLPVSAALYLPDSPGKHPGVIFLSGHANDGKASVNWQTCCQTLARMGCVVFAPDPIGQGERWQFLDAEHRELVEDECPKQHNALAKQLLLCGEFFGIWRIWDATRALDYLLSRPEVDPERIGATGTSGGGTMSSYLFAVDDRVKMAAPGSYITSWRRNIENELSADSEQCIPGLLGQGVEMVDLLIARAPQPVRILAQQFDFFDVRGAKEAYADLKKIHTLFGTPENAEIRITADERHGFSAGQRGNMYDFFNNRFGLGAIPDEPGELRTESITASPSGQLMEWKGRGYRLVHDFIEDIADKLRGSRRKLSEEELRAYFKDKLHLPEPETMLPKDYRVLEPIFLTYEDLIGRFRLESEDGVDVILKIARSPYAWQIPDMDDVRLFVPHLDSIVEHKELPHTDALDCLLDVRGIGELEPAGAMQVDRWFFHSFQADYFYDATYRMLGSSYLDGKVRDIFKAVALLRSFGCRHLTLRGNGQGTIPVVIAALFLDCDVELTGAPESWESMVRARFSLWPQSCMVAGVLEKTDLPDIYEVLGPRLKLLTHWDSMMERIG